MARITAQKRLNIVIYSRLSPIERRRPKSLFITRTERPTRALQKKPARSRPTRL